MMTTAQLFDLFNLLAMLAWIPLFLSPKFKLRIWVLKSKIVPVFLAISYLIFFLGFMFAANENPPALDFSFEGIKMLFTKDEAILVGWLHYLAFDMMVGIYEAEDAIKRKMPQLLLLPCLVFTFMLGPIGWLMYWGLSKMYPYKLDQAYAGKNY
jgi:hypothetical protein